MLQRWRTRAIMLALTVLCLFAQAPKRVESNKQIQSRSTSSFASTSQDGQQSVEITNVDYELAGPEIAGRPRQERLVLRKTCHTKQVVDEIGMEASCTVEAWPLGIDLKGKPLYSITIPGVDPKLVNGNLLTIARGLEEVEWWSVYKLGSGAHLFDTYAPLVQLSIGWPERDYRYAGLEVPPDDVSDPRLKAPKVVAVLTYASAERVIREALITADDPKLAQLLRSYADSSRTVSLVDHPAPAAPGNQYRPPAQSLRISIQSFPSPPVAAMIEIPVAGDDLDFGHVQTSSNLHVAPWKR